MIDSAITEDRTKKRSRPVSRVLYALRRDSHSSRRSVAAALQQPTREQRGPRYRSPIWSCSEWGLPCRTALAPYAVRSYRTLSPLPVPLRAIGGLLSVALAVSSRCPGVTWHSALWSPDFPRCTCVRRDCPADSTNKSSRSAPCARCFSATSVKSIAHKVRSYPSYRSLRGAPVIAAAIFAAFAGGNSSRRIAKMR